MRKFLFICFCIISFSTVAQLRNLPDSAFITKPIKIIKTANEKLKLNNIDPQKATIDNWETVLKEIGEVTRTGNTLYCKISNTKNATMVFDKNQLIQVCEMSDDETFDKKDE
jgi:hypothetical protein